MPTRRHVLTGAAAAAGAIALPLTAVDPAVAHPGGPGGGGPFALGVASGDPLPDGVILWTRLLRPRRRALPAAAVEVGVAGRAGRAVPPRGAPRRVQARARAGALGARRRARPASRAASTSTGSGARRRSARSAARRPRRAGAAALSPLRVRRRQLPGLPERLLAGVRRARRRGRRPRRCTSATTSTSTTRPAAFADRRHTTPADARPRPAADARPTTAPGTPSTSATRRCRPRTRRSRGSSTWDDHEVENNYADAGRRGRRHRAEAADPGGVRRAAGRGLPGVLRAHADPGRPAPGRADLRIFRRFDFGDLLRFNVLDTRQYRTDQPGGSPDDFGPAELRHRQHRRHADRRGPGAVAARRARRARPRAGTSSRSR